MTPYHDHHLLGPTSEPFAPPSNEAGGIDRVVGEKSYAGLVDWRTGVCVGLWLAALPVACTPPDGGSAGGPTSTAAGDTTTPGTSTTEPTAEDAADDPDATVGEDAGDEASRCDDAELDDGNQDGGTSGGDAGETFGGMGGDIPIGATVFAVRQDEIEEGTLVEVAGLVVTSPVGTVDAGLITFAQAPEGGQWSAVGIISRYDDIEASPGDRITVIGRVVYDGNYPRLVTDYEDGEIIVDGEAELPPAFVVSLAELNQNAAATLDPYEAAVMRVETPQVSDADVCPGEFALTADLRVDDLFLGPLAPTPATGADFTAILGPLRWTSDGYEVAPRTLDDLVE